MPGAEHTRQDFLRVRAGGRAVTAPDRARDHGGTDRVLAPVVRCLQPWAPQAGEQRVALAAEMMGQAAVVGEPGASVQHPGQLRVQAPGRHGQPVDRPGARRVAVAFREPRPGGGGLPDERVAPVDQMLGAGLVIRRLKAAIRGPAIADEAAVVVGPDQGRRRVEAPAGEDAIDGRVGGGGDMQPGRVPADAPAGLIQRDAGLGPDHRFAVLIGGLTPRREARERLAQAPRRQGQAKPSVVLVLNKWRRIAYNRLRY